MGAYKPNPKNLFTQFFILESYELKINSNMYSSGKKSVVFCFALLLPQILVDFQNQGQIWNLLVLTFSKHPLHVQFDQVLAEIFEVKDTRYHSFIFMRIDLRRWKKQKSEQFDPKIVLFNIKGTNMNKNDL